MLSAAEVGARIEEFKAELGTTSALDMVQKRILFGDCQMLTPEQYFLLKTSVATEFGVHPHDVMVVGSAKLSFSVAPHKRFRHFGNKSDIDVAIVSEAMFAQVWDAVYEQWQAKVPWDHEDDFKSYLFQGWIRPDKLPPSGGFAFGNRWWEFFRQLTASGKFGPYKITGALYKNLKFLESYQRAAVQLCKDRLSI